ncbi:MAG: hypothetical protein IPK13_19850 [Deltaproteobacteria bacterium]|nr:hypothetical protein [Deltaproteobacteria bacterium]
MNIGWLIEIFVEAGVRPETAERAAKETLTRILRRQRSVAELLLFRQDRPFSLHLVRDPLISLARILGVGDERLPFVDDDDRLSVASLGEVLADVGMDPVVGIAYAKVIQAAYEPEDLYQPLWEMLGREGRVQLRDLARMDLQSIRTSWPEFKTDPSEGDLAKGRARGEVIRAQRVGKKSKPQP